MASETTSARPIKLFYSYAHEDEGLRNTLEKHLNTLKRQGFIEEWHDREIKAGDRWADEIDAHLDAAQIILLLISPDFIASDYCYCNEMERALERHGANEACVIPRWDGRRCAEEVGGIGGEGCVQDFSSCES